MITAAVTSGAAPFLALAPLALSFILLVGQTRFIGSLGSLGFAVALLALTLALVRSLPLIHPPTALDLLRQFRLLLLPLIVTL